MRNRKYLGEKPINSRVDGSGTNTAHRIFGEDTSLHVTWRLQGHDNYNGHKFNRTIVSIEFKDLGLSMTYKFKDSGHNGLLVQYALDLMEYETMEEYYKAILILVKESLMRTVESTFEALAKYDRGEYVYPINKDNVDMYRRHNAQYQKAADSIDTTTDDLRFFKKYEETGANYSETRFDY